MSKPHYRVAVGDAVPELDQRLSAELDRVNAEATKGIAPARQLTVQIRDGSGDLAAGMYQVKVNVNGTTYVEPLSVQ